MTTDSVAATRNGWAIRVALGLLLAAAIATMFVDGETASAILAASVLFGLLGAGLVFIRRARTLDKDERRAWTLVGTGLSVGAAGVLFFIVSWLLSPNAGAFGPPDLLFLLGYAVGIAGFAMLPHTYGSRLQRIRLLLDGVIGAVAVGTLLWVFVLKEIADVLGAAPTWERVVGSTYVLIDVALLIVAMIVVVRRSNLRFDIRLVLFSLAAISQAVADLNFLLRGAGKAFGEAEPIYALHIAAAALFLATASIVHRVPQEREYADRSRTPAWVMVLPYGSTALMVVLLVSTFPTQTASVTNQSLMYATLVVGGLAIARQAVAIRENRRLVEDQRTDLVASISHELRTPLTAVAGFLDLLDSGGLEDDTERREVTTIANQQAAYLSRIVSDLVMLASDNFSAMALDIAPTNVDELAWSSVNAAALDPTNVRVDTERDATAFLDGGRMRQALANLLANAERYGGGSALVVARTDGGDLSLEVHDDGPGVPRKYELSIWERFERGPNRLNAVVPGSGIGLAVTNAIAKAHGGTAGYRRSERLGGACFWMRLPGRIHVDLNQLPDDGTVKLSIVDTAKNARSA